MYPIERQQQILELLGRHKSMSVGELSKTLYSGEATVRRDLATLEKLGQLKRTHGGAVSLGGTGREMPLDVRQTEQIRSKAKIASLALSLVKSGMTLFIDGSSTCMRLLPLLDKISPLTVITNGAKTAALLAELYNVNGICTGGILNRTSMVYDGSIPRRVIDGMFSDIFFFSAKSVSVENGITDGHIETAELKRLMLGHAKLKVLLCDQTKFSTTAFAKVCAVSDVDYIVTDSRPSLRFQEFLAKNKVKWLCE